MPDKTRTFIGWFHRGAVFACVSDDHVVASLTLEKRSVATVQLVWSSKRNPVRLVVVCRRVLISTIGKLPAEVVGVCFGRRLGAGVAQLGKSDAHNESGEEST